MISLLRSLGRWPDTSDDHDEGIYARWGGFVKDFDAFDPLFFGISPRDAERMDPQERLFLQIAYHAVENAGYTPETLLGTKKRRYPPETRRRNRWRHVWRVPVLWCR